MLLGIQDAKHQNYVIIRRENYTMIMLKNKFSQKKNKEMNEIRNHYEFPEIMDSMYECFSNSQSKSNLIPSKNYTCNSLKDVVIKILIKETSYRSSSCLSRRTLLCTSICSCQARSHSTNGHHTQHSDIHQCLRHHVSIKVLLKHHHRHHQHIYN